MVIEGTGNFRKRQCTFHMDADYKIPTGYLLKKDITIKKSI